MAGDHADVLDLAMCLWRQVGKVDSDHNFWGRPEDMTMFRPSYKVTPSRPGSDVAGNTASALAAGYLYFKDEGQWNHTDIFIAM